MWGANAGNVVVTPTFGWPSCKATQQIRTLTLGDPCVENLKKVIDTCITGKPDDVGGYYLESSDGGCWQWWIFGQELPDNTTSHRVRNLPDV
jgi:hypothetical protein